MSGSRDISKSVFRKEDKFILGDEKNPIKFVNLKLLRDCFSRTRSITKSAKFSRDRSPEEFCPKDTLSKTISPSSKQSPEPYQRQIWPKPHSQVPLFLQSHHELAALCSPAGLLADVLQQFTQKRRLKQRLKYANAQRCRLCRLHLFYQ